LLLGFAGARGDAFDALLKDGALEDPVDEDAGRVDVVLVQRPGLDQMLDLTAKAEVNGVKFDGVEYLILREPDVLAKLS